MEVLVSGSVAGVDAVSAVGCSCLCSWSYKTDMHDSAALQLVPCNVDARESKKKGYVSVSSSLICLCFVLSECLFLLTEFTIAGR